LTINRDMASLKRRYLLDIELYERTYKTWHTRGRNIVKRYRDERDSLQQLSQAGDTRYNILWSNIQTTLPAVFARLPKPEVSRRYKDKDPVGRVASLLLERALEYEIEHYTDYASAVHNSVEDRLLPGRGVAWVRYEPVMKSAEMPDGQITEDVPESVEVIDYECTPVDYVAWEDFGHNVARTWEEVSIVWRRVPLTRSELVERFGSKANQITLDQKSDLDDDVLSTPEGETLKKATIYEIWDKKEGIVLWLSKSYAEALDVRDDPLQLDCFFPCPKPLYATVTTNSIIPVPDYAQYQDQAQELDLICERIDGLVKAVKVVGVYDASQTGIQRMLQEGVNNTLIPVDTWAAFAEKGGIKGVVDFLPLDMVAKALVTLYEAREQAKAVIYEITGISDIIRGASDPNETLGAQQLKGQFASKRLKKLQDSVATFATDLLRIKAQIICKHYQPQSIAMISGAGQLSPQDQQLVGPALELLKNGQLSDFRIEVSSDSLIEVDEQQEKQNRMEFLTAVSGFIEQAAMAPPALAPLLGEMLLYGVRAFKAGKQLEGTIEETLEKLKEQAANPAPPPPDPEVIKVEAQQQIEQAKLQGQMQLEQAKLQSQMQIEQAKLQLEHGKGQAEMQTEAQRNDLEAQRQAQELEMQRQTEMMKAQIQQETELKKAEIQAQAQITIAEINAKASVVTGAVSGGEEGEPKESSSEKMIQEIFQKVHEMAEESSAPTEIGRGPDGKVISIKKGKRTMSVAYGPDGRMSGIN